MLLFSSSPTLGDGESNRVFKVATYNVHPGENPTGYHGLRKAIVEDAGFTIEFIVVPARRMPYALETHYVDAISVSGLASESRPRLKQGGFLQAQYPDRIVPVDIYYKENSQWQPNWPADFQFKNGVRGISINYSYLHYQGFSMKQIPSYSSGTLMVNFGRADYWIDTIPDASRSFSAYKRTAAEGYKKEKLFDSPLFLLFVNNERGGQFKRIFDRGMANLIDDERRLRSIFVPDNNPRGLASLDAFLAYMRSTYPELRHLP